MWISINLHISQIFFRGHEPQEHTGNNTQRRTPPQATTTTHKPRSTLDAHKPTPPSGGHGRRRHAPTTTYNQQHNRHQPPCFPPTRHKLTTGTERETPMPPFVSQCPCQPAWCRPYRARDRESGWKWVSAMQDRHGSCAPCGGGAERRGSAANRHGPHFLNLRGPLSQTGGILPSICITLSQSLPMSLRRKGLDLMVWTVPFDHFP